jgi:tRNA pseudouridine55 synthase
MEESNLLEGGILLIDKPLHWTSFDVVKKTRNLLRTHFQVKKIKVGHAGTLDPLASGLLVVCTGKFTKRINEFQAQEKEYTGTFTLGSTTPSYDLETEINQTFSTLHITEEEIQKTSQQFIGIIEQFPPVFSALKKDGERLYEKARRGEKVKVEARQVQIASFEISRVELPEIDFRVVCSKGTYIRSLAHDFGKALNSGAHLSALCRRRIGNFELKQSLDIETLKEFIESQAVPNSDV